MLHEDFAHLRKSVHRFESEARVMANHEHPHIVRVDDFGETDSRYSLRMELVEGVTPGRCTAFNGAAKIARSHSRDSMVSRTL